MSKLLGSLLLIGGLAASLNAGATVSVLSNTYNLGTLPGGLTSFNETVGTGAFSDVIDFTIGSPSKILTGVQSINVSVGAPSPLFSISNLTADLYNSSGKLLGAGTSISLANTQLAGAYSEVIKGNATGSFGGIYAGSIAISPVPEASTWAMLLVGLGLLGVTVLRKKA